MSFRLEDLLALPLQPSIRVRIGPAEVIEVDQVAWESSKDEFISWASSLPNTEQGIGYHLLKPYTNNNGMLAKLTIALGDLAGLWRMYPSPDQPALWGRIHPTIMPLRQKDQRRKVPKPSAGDLDPAKFCTCCERGMGPPDSQVHDLVESDETPGLCLECDLVCGARAAKCQLGQKPKQKHAAYTPPETRAEEQEIENIIDLVGVEFEDYAKQFGSD